MALTFSEGSIGGDIERVDLRELQRLLRRRRPWWRKTNRRVDGEPRGSNGFAIAPS